MPPNRTIETKGRIVFHIDFDETDGTVWYWQQLVADLGEADMEYVVHGPSGRSRGLVGCFFSHRPGSYDHSRHHNSKTKAKTHDEHLGCWDFVVERADGTAVRMHPEWSTTKFKCFNVDGHEEPVAPPAAGLGNSDGRGTFKHYKLLGVTKTLRFSNVPAKPAVAGSSS